MNIGQIGNKKPINLDRKVSYQLEALIREPLWYCLRNHIDGKTNTRISNELWNQTWKQLSYQLNGRLISQLEEDLK